MARSAAAMWRPYQAPERPRTAAPRRREKASAIVTATAEEKEIIASSRITLPGPYVRFGLSAFRYC